MSKAERERSHQATLERISRVLVLAGTGDRTRIDHEGTLLERARMLCEEIQSHEATERGLAALDRLLKVLERRDPRHGRDVAEFLLALWGNRPLALTTLRGHDAAVGDDLLAVLDAYRHARLNLLDQVEGGARRVARVLNQHLASTG